MNEPLVSVITPVYNGAAFLAEAIESVLAQTYAHWEHVIVDNRSTDETGDLARRYAARDRRIRVIDNTRHVDVIENHNIAFRAISAAARYVKPVHADDWLFPECLARMVALAEANPTVGLVSAYALEDGWVDLDGLPYPSTVVPGRDICRLSLLGGPYVFGSPTATLVRADLVRARERFYDEASIHADEAACYDVLSRSDFGFVHQVLTATRTHAGRMTTVASRVNSFLAGNLLILRRYGPRFLTAAEYERRLAERTDEYYSFLAREILSGGNRDALRYHRAALRDLGCPIDGRRLAVGLLREAWRTLISPSRVLRRLRRARPGKEPTAAWIAEARARWQRKAAERAAVDRVFERGA